MQVGLLLPTQRAVSKATERWCLIITFAGMSFSFVFLSAGFRLMKYDDGMSYEEGGMKNQFACIHLQPMIAGPESCNYVAELAGFDLQNITLHSEMALEAEISRLRRCVWISRHHVGRCVDDLFDPQSLHEGPRGGWQASVTANQSRTAKGFCDCKQPQKPASAACCHPSNAGDEDARCIVASKNA